ncbi:MAG: nucleotide exchange factor GrpE [Bacteroidales bacterium]|nr:nucleotide exchange factor GrpE [Bacteroidales bacterium]
MGDKKKNKKNSQDVENKEVKTDVKEFEEVKGTEEPKDSKDVEESKKAEEVKEEKDPLAELQEKYNELNDKYVRLYSEYDNFRRRTANEKIELIKTASEGAISAMLPILDDFERALPTMEKSEDKSNYEGALLIYNKLKKTLEQKGLEEINANGAEFNTDEHEALTQIPAPEETLKGKVMDVIQKGYKLNGKVIRYARVVVGC